MIYEDICSAKRVLDYQRAPQAGNGGLILVRELDERLGFSALIAQHITDPRGKNTQFPLADLVRQSVYRRLAGYEDVNDVERLSHDPTFCGRRCCLGPRGRVRTKNRAGLPKW